jgi:hypothetical protein
MNVYMLSVWHKGDYPTAEDMAAEDMQAAFEAVDRFNQKLMDQGAWVFGGGLHEPSTATVVEEKDGEVLLTDGPFAEAKEQIGGFWIIRAEDLDAALAWAREATVACANPVEVRPFQDDTEA